MPKIMNEEYFKLIAENTTDTIIILDTSANIKYIAYSAISKHGYKAGELTGENVFTIIPESEREKFTKIFKEGIKKTDFNTWEELPIISKNGSLLYVEIRGKTITENNKITGLILNCRDITSKKKNEEELKELSQRLSESETLYRTLIDSMTELFFLKDDNLNHMIVNKAYMEFLGKTEEEITGKGDYELLPEELADSCRQSDLMALKSNSLSITQETFKDKVYKTIKFPVRLKDNKLCVGGYIKDITEEKKIRENEVGYIGNIEFLSQAIIELVKFSYEDDIYTFISHKLKELFPDAVIIINSFDNETDTLTLRSISGIEQQTGFFDYLNLNFEKMSVPINDEAKNILKHTNKLSVVDSIYSLVFGKMPRTLCDEIEKKLDLGNIYTIGFNKEGELFGNAVIIMKKDKELKNPKIVETLINMASIVIQKRILHESVEKSRDFYFKLFDDFPNPVWKSGIDGKCNYVNQSWVEFTGLKAKDTIENGWENLIHPEDADYCINNYMDFFKSRKPFKIECRLRYNDGEYHYILNYGNPLYDIDGNFTGYIGSCYDIHDIKISEQEILKLSDFLNLVIENANVWINVMDPDFNILLWNKAAELISGYRYEEVINQNIIWQNLYPHQRYQKRIMDKIKFIMADHKESDYFETIIQTKNRENKVISWYCKKLTESEDSSVSVITIGVDITERKRMEENLKYRFEIEKLITAISARFINISSDELENEIHKALEIIGEFMAVDRGYVVQFSEDNTKIDKTCEWHAEDIEPHVFNLKNCHIDVFPWWKQKVENFEVIHIPRVADLPPNANLEKYLPGFKNIQSLVIIPMMFEKSIIGFMGFDSIRTGRIWSEDDINLLKMLGEIFANTIVNKRFEKTINQQKESLAVTLRSIGDGVISTDIKGRIVLMNKVAENLTGWTHEEALGKYIAEVFNIIDPQTNEPCKNLIYQVIKSATILEIAKGTILIDKRGMKKLIEDSAAPIKDDQSNTIGVVLVFRDITEKIKMEEDSLNFKKLESLGILAGGIAHDFNNILTVILGNINLAKLYIEPENKSFDKLVESEKACLHAQSLTKQLLTFSEGGAPVRKIVSIKSLLKDFVRFALSGSNVKAEFSIQDALWSLEIDEWQIRQAINNIILNACQAMPDGGLIQINAQNMVISYKYAMKPGKYVKISIKDYGEGIAKENLSKIFDPYFSTKPEGGGLGLASAYSIISRHNGYIDVKSEEGKGSTFHIYLPASSENSEHRIDKNALKNQTDKKNILIMDDEELILELAGEYIDYLGHNVFLAKDGQEMLDLYIESMKNGKKIDLIIMDLTIPGGMGGKEAIKKLLEIAPEAKAIVSSGYSTDPIMANFKEYGFKGVLPKPYTIDELKNILNNVL